MNTALNYQPEVLVDTADLSREDWLDYRRLGIGGSDAAAGRSERRILKIQNFCKKIQKHA